jgi:transposase
VRPRVALIVWHLLADPAARFRDLGPDWHTRKGDRDRKIRAHLRQLQALGLDVTITPAA